MELGGARGGLSRSLPVSVGVQDSTATRTTAVAAARPRQAPQRRPLAARGRAASDGPWSLGQTEMHRQLLWTRSSVLTCVWNTDQSSVHGPGFRLFAPDSGELCERSVRTDRHRFGASIRIQVV